MNRRTLFTIVLGALVLHAALFLVLARTRPLPKMRHVPPPNFGYKERTYVDPVTGEKEIHREIRVSTRLADARKVEEMERRAGMKKAE
jgi:hypothetical protein